MRPTVVDTLTIARTETGYVVTSARMCGAGPTELCAVADAYAAYEQERIAMIRESEHDVPAREEADFNARLASLGAKLRAEAKSQS